MSAKLQETLKNIELLYKEASEQFQSALMDALEEVREKYPNVKAVAWTQYTPFFNDGEACEFGVGDPEFIIDEKSVDEIREIWNENNGYVCDEVDTLDWKQSSDLLKQNETLKLIFGSESGEKLCHDCFGDHTRVLVTIEDRSVYLEEYDHE